MEIFNDIILIFMICQPAIYRILQNQIYVCWTQMIHKGYVTLPNRLPSPNETNVSLDTYLQDFVSDKSDKVHPLCKCIFLMNVIATSLI